VTFYHRLDFTSYIFVNVKMMGGFDWRELVAIVENELRDFEFRITGPKIIDTR
jgi:hypothetical protein